MSTAPSLAVSVVSAGLALALLSLLLYKLLRGLAVLAVVLLPLRLFGALHAVAALPLGIAGQATSLRAGAVGAGLWALGHWLFARSRGYYAALWAAGYCGRSRCPAWTRPAATSSARSTSTCPGRSRWCWAARRVRPSDRVDASPPRAS